MSYPFLWQFIVVHNSCHNSVSISIPIPIQFTVLPLYIDLWLLQFSQKQWQLEWDLFQFLFQLQLFPAITTSFLSLCSVSCGPRAYWQSCPSPSRAWASNSAASTRSACTPSASSLSTQSAVCLFHLALPACQKRGSSRQKWALWPCNCLFALGMNSFFAIACTQLIPAGHYILQCPVHWSFQIRLPCSIHSRLHRCFTSYSIRLHLILSVTVPTACASQSAGDLHWASLSTMLVSLPFPREFALLLQIAILNQFPWSVTLNS